MPWPTIIGSRVPLNLQARFVGVANRLPLNLGVDGDMPDPPDPPDPTVVGGIVVGRRLAWASGASTVATADLSWGGGAAVNAIRALDWGGMLERARSSELLWQTPALLSASRAVAWRGASPTAARWMDAPWRTPQLTGSRLQLVWGRGEARAGSAVHAPWRAPPMHGRSAAMLWVGDMQRTGRAAPVLWSAPPRQYRHWRMPWGRGDGLEWIVRPPVPEPPPPPTPPGFPSGRFVGLNLGCPVFTGDTRRVPLNLGITACWNARTHRKAYIVLNEISVVRLPDRLPIDVDAVSIVGDREAWAWNASLALANPGQLADLAPTASGPRSVEITLNGYAWVIAIEAFDKGDVFGATAVNLTGRSVTAQLSEPYAAPRTREVTQDRTMVQLADLEVAGTAVTLDYGTVSWLVPAGAWYYDSLSPMSALKRLAEASGGVVQSHPTDPVLEVRPRYPVSPWNWTTSTPDVVIPDDVVTGSRLQLQSKPLFDAVIVAGERIGVATRVRRDGEAGQTYAPQQIDQLIVHADGARERGRNVLSDRGGQASIEHDLPLFGGTLQAGQPGLVMPLMLAQRQTAAETWHGLVTGVRIQASRQGQAVDIVQTVTIERHYTDAD